MKEWFNMDICSIYRVAQNREL